MDGLASGLMEALPSARLEKRCFVCVLHCFLVLTELSKALANSVLHASGMGASWKTVHLQTTRLSRALNHALYWVFLCLPAILDVPAESLALALRPVIARGPGKFGKQVAMVSLTSKTIMFPFVEN